MRENAVVKDIHIFDVSVDEQDIGRKRAESDDDEGSYHGDWMSTKTE